MRPLPLKWRVSLVIAAAQAAAIAIVCVITYVETKDLLYSQLDRSLSSAARTVATELGEQSALPLEQRLRAVVGVTPKRYSPFLIVAAFGTRETLVQADPLSRSAGFWNSMVDKFPGPTEDRPLFIDIGAGDEAYRVIWTIAQTPRGPVEILVGQSRLQIQGEIRELIAVLVLAGGSAIILSGVAVMLLVAWALRPIRRTAKRLLKVTASNVGNFAKESPPVPSELRPFVKSVEDMLARLEESMARQRAFISDAAHELRTPLTLAKSTAQLALSKEVTAAEYRESLSQLLSDLRRMERLAEELLTLARLEETHPASEQSDVDLEELLRSLTEIYAPLAAETGGRIECDVSQARVCGDEALLRRLFGNLIENAIKHGPRGGAVKLTVSANGDGWARAVVHDEGGKIPPELLPRLFDRFFRADPSRSHSTGGAGLGLAIARQIVLRHGGKISITSEPGSGTNVLVRLPIKD